MSFRWWCWQAALWGTQCSYCLCCFVSMWSWGRRYFAGTTTCSGSYHMIWLQPKGLSLLTCVCVQVMNESLQQMGPLVPSNHSGAIWCSSDPLETSAEACVVTKINIMAGFSWKMYLKLTKLIVQMEICLLEVRYFLVA